MTLQCFEKLRDKSVPNVLKLDVEGAEASVLEGASFF